MFLGIGLLCYDVDDAFIQARYSKNETQRRTRRIAGVTLVQTVWGDTRGPPPAQPDSPRVARAA
jgi:hypothetical protein